MGDQLVGYAFLSLAAIATICGLWIAAKVSSGTNAKGVMDELRQQVVDCRLQGERAETEAREARKETAECRGREQRLTEDNYRLLQRVDMLERQVQMLTQRGSA